MFCRAEYPGNDQFAACLEQCLKQSADRRYHRDFVSSNVSRPPSTNRHKTKTSYGGSWRNNNSKSNKSNKINKSNSRSRSNYNHRNTYTNTKTNSRNVSDLLRVTPKVVTRTRQPMKYVKPKTNFWASRIESRNNRTGTMNATRNVNNVSNVNANVNVNRNRNMHVEQPPVQQVQQHQVQFSNGMNLVNKRTEVGNENDPNNVNVNTNNVTVNFDHGRKKENEQYQSFSNLNNFNNNNNNRNNNYVNYNYHNNNNNNNNSNMNRGSGYNDSNSLSNTESYISGTIYEATTPSDTPVLKPLRPVRPPLIQRKYLVDSLMNSNVNSSVHTVNDSGSIISSSTNNIMMNDYNCNYNGNSVSQVSQMTQVTNNGSYLSRVANTDSIATTQAEAEEDEEEDVPAPVRVRTRRRGVRKSVKKKMAEIAKQQKILENASSVSGTETTTTTKPKRRRRRRKKKSSNKKLENDVSDSESDAAKTPPRRRKRRRRKQKGDTNEKNTKSNVNVIENVNDSDNGVDVVTNVNKDVNEDSQPRRRRRHRGRRKKSGN